jgi:glycosyltransferase involved in cell wall biosynthesis
LRILHAILSGGFYGSERYCIDLAIAQSRAGHDVTVLVADAGSVCAQQFRRAIAQAYGEEMQCSAVRLVAIPGYVPPWLHRPAAAIVLALRRPDIVHTHLNPAARRIGAIAQRLGIPHLLTLHLDYDAHEHASIDGLVALHAKQREQIPPEFAGEVAIIWNWLPSCVEAALAQVLPEEVRRLRGSWGADDTTIVFGSVGRLMPEKGMDVLIRAFRVAFAGGSPDVRLVIVGDGPQRNELERGADGDGRIRFAGSQSDIALFYCGFDVFVSAARFEPFGLAIVEAMAAGCPLIATSIHGTVEFVTHPRTLWTEPGRDDQLVPQLCKAAIFKRERFTYDMSRLTLARAVNEMDEFYRRIASRR